MAEIETSEVNVDAILDPQDIRVSIEDVIVIKGQDADIAAAEAATSAANEAATNANNATLNANEATENANNAASNANEAASNANNAAANLREAAERGDFDGAPGAPGKDGSDATATDVRIAGNSITVDGVADVPLASYGSLGMMQVQDSNRGLTLWNGNLSINKATEALIDARKTDWRSGYFPIVPSNLDNAVKSAMCDGKGAAWSDTEKLAARERLGAAGNMRLIADITTTENAVVVIDKDMSGNSFDLSCIELFYFAPKQGASVESSGNVAVLNDIYGSIGNARIMTISYGSPNANKLCDAYGTANVIGSTVLGSCGAISDTNGVLDWIASSSSNGKGIKCLKFISTANTVHVPAGTRIIVRGV